MNWRSLGLVTLLAWTLVGRAQAQCCAGYSPASVCADTTLTKSRWCIQDSVPNAQSALPKTFCKYGDEVVSTLETVFGIQARDTFEFELDAQTGGAHTGTACDHLGNGVAYDGFNGHAYGVDGFWGYLLSLHEAINDWTGMSSGGWPTDWWADHQSAFPNLIDFHAMAKLGTDDADPNLSKAAAAQKKRFYPGGDSADAKVVALDNVFAAMPGGDGFAGFSRLFALQSGDGVKWDSLGVGNPDVKRSEYVVAYMSLAAHARVLDLLQGPGANGGGNICNGTPDGTQGDTPYTCSAEHIDQIATAHCAIQANGRPAGDLSALRAGQYQNVASGSCGASCPSECACDGMRCVAAWLGPAQTGGSSAAADGGGGGSSGAHAGASAAGRAASDGGRTASAAGHAAGDGGRSAGDGGRSAGDGGRSGAAGGAGSGSAGHDLGGAAAVDTKPVPRGCACSAFGLRDSRPCLPLMAAATFGFLFVRRRRRGR
jgi:hypothetical protein